MENISPKTFSNVGIPYNLFLQWCEDNKKNPSTIKTKKEFFRLILDGRLKIEGNNLIKKRVRHDETSKTI